MSTRRELFGGAITISLPSTFIDASTIRQVPDTQEVFVADNSEVSFVIEILERVHPDDPAAAAIFHFDSLAHDNDAVSNEVQSVDTSQMAEVTVDDPLTTPPPIILYGTQKVCKFNRTVPDSVHVLLAVYRIVSKNIDLVLSANLPEKSEANMGLSPTEVQDGKETFVTAIRSLRIVDFGLFV